MNKVLFTHSYFLRFDPKQWAIGTPYPPLGTLYAAASMRENGYQVSLFDNMFRASADDVEAALDEQEPDLFVMYDDGFNYLTKMCLTNMREAALQMCATAKAKDCKVIVSSSDATDHCAEYLAAGADFVIIGEAEQTLLELANQIKNEVNDYTGILGLAYFKNGGVFKTPARLVLKELDTLPLPAWDLIDVDAYRESWLKNAGYFSLNMVTTRGCPYKCNWCAKPIYGNRYNSHSPQRIATEMRMLKENYQIDHIWFCDDIFGLKPGWIKELSRELAKDQTLIRFKIQSRADLLTDEGTVQALADCGCENVWIGAESGSQKILDAMDKGTTIEQIRTATRLMKSVRIKPSFFIQFGYPGETREDIGETIQMINELLPFEIGISVSYPLPGTVFYDRVKTDLKKKTNWTDSDEMALMFSNTYPASYYKQLHKYVHKNYRKHLAKSNLQRIFKTPAAVSIGQLKKAISYLYYSPATLIERRRLDRLEASC